MAFTDWCPLLAESGHWTRLPTIELRTMPKHILIRNLTVVGIFAYLFLSNVLHYEINVVVVVTLILVAWIVSPVRLTFKHLYARFFGQRTGGNS